MSMDQLTPLVFGTALVLVIIVSFFVVVRYVRNQYFPSDRSDKLSGAMLQMQILQAELESRTAEGLVSPGEGDGESDGEVGDSALSGLSGESNAPAAEEPDPPAPGLSDPPERQE